MDLLRRLQTQLPPGTDTPGIFRELAATLGIPAEEVATQRPEAYHLPSQDAPDADGQSGAKKQPRRARIAEVASPYSRPPSTAPDRRHRSPDAVNMETDGGTPTPTDADAREPGAGMA